MLTERQPNLSRMQRFGSECFAYKQDKRKLHARCEKCVFIGYENNSLAYIVYFPVSTKVQKHKLVKFVATTGVEQQTQTQLAPEDDDFIQHRSRSPNHHVTAEHEPEVSHHQPRAVKSEVKCEFEIAVSQYISKEETDQVQSNIDYSYQVMCNNIPVSFTDAETSDKSRGWVKAMDEEMHSLRVNNTFTLTKLPEGNNAVGGRYSRCMQLKLILTNRRKKQNKACYIAKGYSGMIGVDYEEAFSPTANMTSVRILMQKAAEERP